MKLIKKYIQLFCYLTISIITIACSDNKNNSGSYPIPEVAIIKAAPTNIELTNKYSGKIVGSKEVEVRAQVGGILVKKIYTEGQAVKKGDILFKIDPEPYEAKLSQAKSTLKEAKARFIRAEKDWKRASVLYQKKIISDRSYDSELSSYELAKAEVNKAEALLHSARINLDNTTVKAPIDGFISQETKSEGNLIGNMSENNLLTKIVQLDPIYVVFSYTDTELVRHNELVKNQNNLKITLKFDNGKNYPHTGYIDFIDNIINSRTGSINARGVFKNPDNILIPGQFVKILVTGINLNNVFVIPDKATMQGPQGTFVYVVNSDNKVNIRPVILGAMTEHGRLIENGLEGGEQIVVEGMIKIRPDQVVKIATLQN